MAYDIAILGVRGAIHAARTNQRDLIAASLHCLTLDKNLLDWRDVLSALALIERCSQEVGADFVTMATNAANAADSRRQSLILDYLLREPVMRSTKVMGYDTIGSGANLRFEKCI